MTSTLNKADLVQASKPHPSGSCPVQAPRPITPLLGTETHTIDTGWSVGGQPLLLTFDNRKVFAAAALGLSPKAMGNMPALGALWESSLHKNLKFGVGGFGIQLLRGNGTAINFTYNPVANTYVATGDGNDTFLRSPYRFVRASGAVETYNTNGRLDLVAYASGATLTYTYSDNGMGADAPADGYLLGVADNAGRSLSFSYMLPVGGAERTDALISKITNSAGQSILIGYDAAQNLSTVTWPDGKTQTYVYENSTLPWAMTGLVDENNNRFITWGYDTGGRAVSSVLAGGVEAYNVTYTTAPGVSMLQSYNATTGITTQSINTTPPTGTVLQLPNGQSTAITGASLQGSSVATGLSQPGGAGCAASTSASTFDANGNLTSKDDFAGMRSCMAYDTKNQEMTRVEGLSNTADCTTVLSVNAILPAGARKITTTYHPDWRLPTKVTAPGSMTTVVYQGQPDPFNSNTAASCINAGNLPNNKPLPMVCKQVTQATLANGTLDASVPNVVATYSYDASGRILTSKDTFNRTTSYAYYTATAFTGTDPNAVGHTIGDLQTITGPSGFVTTFNAYDKAGRLLQSTDPKGVITDTTYTPRGWVNSVTTTAPGQTARTTTYTYDNVGQLTGVLSPDGTSTTMAYDAAHRLIGASDAKGNSVAYTLDNMGNRTGEQIKDPSGVLQLQMQRSFDALNRVQQVKIGAP